jgi:thiol-disulfide isomerase/thioredoxin
MPGPQPEVGKPMPDFILNHVTHYKKTNASSSDFKGKWLFLDFWFTTCTACIQSFPKVNEIHKQFKNELNWMLVGLNDKEYGSGIEQFYKKISVKQNLEMPAAFDSALINKWEINSMPHIIIVDPSGIVRYITNGSDITVAKIRDLLDGKNVSFLPTNIEKPKFNANEVSATDSKKNANDKLIYRSVLTEWNGEAAYIVELDRWLQWPKEHLKKGFNLARVPLYALYNYAYVGEWRWSFDIDSLYGKVYPTPVLEMTDTSLFKYDYKRDDGGFTGLYNYNLLLPLADVTKPCIMKDMQEDLRRSFKYDAVIEIRSMPVWKLQAQPGTAEKLKTKGGNKFFSDGVLAMGYSFRNYPSKYLIRTLSSYLPDAHKFPFIDETGIADNIDFGIDADMTSITDVKKELQKQGLDLVKGTQKMKVLVIRDPKK